MSDPYIRNGYVVRVIDGDSLAVTIDLGFSVSIGQIVRLAGVNAPEVVGANKAAGLAAKSFLQALLPSGTAVTFRTIKPREKYGRYLAIVYLAGASVNDLLGESGHAVVWPAVVKAPAPDAAETEGGSID